MSDEWLTRLTPADWIAAAVGELQRATLALHHKQHRAGVTQARRAAGMAWNAVLCGIADGDERARYGRSYMDHLKALREDVAVSAAIREAARVLVAAPLDLAERLVQLGAGDTTLAKAAATIVEEAQRRLAPSATN